MTDLTFGHRPGRRSRADDRVDDLFRQADDLASVFALVVLIGVAVLVMALIAA